MQNFPILASVTSGSTTVEGTLDSTPGTEFRLAFFSNSACDPSGHGEGETFLGSTTVTTDAAGNVGFTVTLANSATVGHFVTATATDPDGNTSEFSPCQLVEAGSSTITVTLTHALLPGSPAINAGDDSAAPATDQRGVPRPQGLRSDIGAYERGPDCARRASTIVGTDAAETIVGTARADVIVAKGGADIVRALGGNDTVCGGPGDDKVFGDKGRDRLFGGAGLDVLKGQGGKDLLNGGRGNDVLFGNRGDDRLLGKAGGDELNCGPGNDTARGGPGADTAAGCETLTNVP